MTAITRITLMKYSWPLFRESISSAMPMKASKILQTDRSVVLGIRAFAIPKRCAALRHPGSIQTLDRIQMRRFRLLCPSLLESRFPQALEVGLLVNHGPGIASSRIHMYSPRPDLVNKVLVASILIDSSLLPTWFSLFTPIIPRCCM